MANLTEAKIRKLKWDPTKGTTSGRQIYSDGVVKGLQLRVLEPKTGGMSTKNFYQAFGPSTNRKFYKVGEWGDITLEQARSKARKVRRDFYERGIDPNAAKKRKVQQAQAKLTVKELVDKYLDAHPVPVWSASYASSNTTLSKKLVKGFGNMLAENLDKKDLRPLFVKIKEETPAQAKHFRGFVSRMFDWATDEELIDEMTNPAILVRSRSKTTLSEFQDPPSVERDRVLESDKGEATELFGLLKDFDPLWTHMAKLYLLLGFRNKELRMARWEHIDLENRLIKNVEPKGGKKNAYRAYLCDMAIDCLKALGLGKIAKGPIFPAEGLHKSKDKSRSDWDFWYRTISKDSRMPRDGDGEYIHIHDLRRTAITWLQEMRCDDDERTIFKGSRPLGVTARNYSKGKKEYVHKRCTEAIEERLYDIEAGNEKNMFEPWRGRLNPTRLES
jgi:integrase